MNIFPIIQDVFPYPVRTPLKCTSRYDAGREWCCPILGDGAEQLRLQDELSFLVLLARLVGLVVLPADRLLALAALDVAHYVTARGHVALVRVGLGDVDDAVEQVRLAVLAAEVLGCVSIAYVSARLSR
jgi:hypothetical protein